MGEPEAIKRVLGFIAQQAEGIPSYFRKMGLGIMREFCTFRQESAGR